MTGVPGGMATCEAAQGEAARTQLSGHVAVHAEPRAGPPYVPGHHMVVEAGPLLDPSRCAKTWSWSRHSLRPSGLTNPVKDGTNTHHPCLEAVEERPGAQNKLSASRRERHRSRTDLHGVPTLHACPSSEAQHSLDRIGIARFSESVYDVLHWKLAREEEFRAQKP